MSAKVFNIHVLKHMAPSPSGDFSLELMGRWPVPEFVWIQGVVTQMYPESMQYIIDDGTGGLMVSAEAVGSMDVHLGEYVLVQGKVVVGDDEETRQKVVIVIARIISRIEDPNMEALWWMEVIQSFKRLESSSQ